MIIDETGISQREYEQYNEQYLSTLKKYTYIDFVELINSFPIRNTFKENIIDRYQNDLSLYTKYPDVDETLDYLIHKGYSLGIFSEGVTQFQETKLKNLQISKFINSELIFIHIPKDDHAYLDSLPISITVDDSVDVCNKLVEHGKHMPIHCKSNSNRYAGRNREINSEEIRSIQRLKELTKLF